MSQRDRVDALDVLRAVALFGVLTVNLVTAFRVSLFEQFLPPRGDGTAIDHAIGRALTLGVESKAFIVFSFLFGVGLAVQYERARSFAAYASRRLAFLLVLGLAHLYLIWNGDILTLYAVAGIVAAPLLRLPTRALLVLAIVLFVVQFAPLPYPSSFPSPRAMAEHVERARRVYPYGGFGAVLAFRIKEVSPVSALLIYSAPRTLGLFLLGACAWRSRILIAPRRRSLFVALSAMIPIGALLVWASLNVSLASLGAWGGIVGGWGAILLALGYAAAIVVALDTPRVGAILMKLAPLGRMALTSYLTQSIVLGFVFYGYGLGLFGKLGELEALGIAISLYAAQAIASGWWLARYRFGPVEWVWRSFTYGARQPMLKE